MPKNRLKPAILHVYYSTTCIKGHCANTKKVFWLKEAHGKGI